MSDADDRAAPKLADTEAQIEALRRHVADQCVSIASSIDTTPAEMVPPEMRERWLQELRQAAIALALVVDRLVDGPKAEAGGLPPVTTPDAMPEGGAPMTTPTLEDFVREVARYQRVHRNLGRKPLTVSGLYDLDPDTPTVHPTAAAWPATWPHNGKPGVYAVLAADLTLRYVGKADILGKRLSALFRGGVGRRRPRVYDPATWPKDLRRYVVVVPVKQPFETLPLQAHLIRHLSPPDNAIG
jgi:hypothetical protein